jgi:hypothetical protein
LFITTSSELAVEPLTSLLTSFLVLVTEGRRRRSERVKGVKQNGEVG